MLIPGHFLRSSLHHFRCPILRPNMSREISSPGLKEYEISNSVPAWQNVTSGISGLNWALVWGRLPAPYLICGPIFAPRPPYSGAAVPHWQPTEQVSLHKTKCMTRSKEKYTIKIKMARGPTPNSLPNITNKCRVLHYLAGWRKCVLFLLDLDEFLFWCLMSFVKYKIGKFQYYWGWTCSQFKFLWWSQCIHFQNPQSPKKISTTTELSFSDIFLIVAYPSWFGHTYVGYESTVSRPYLMDLSAPPRVADTNLHNRISLPT